jgi:type I restriction enzyme S subunit
MSEFVPEGWKPCELGSLASKIEGGGTPSRNEPLFWGGNIPWATVKDLKGVRLSVTQEYISQLGLDKSASKLIPANTLIIASRMAVGKAVVFDKSVSINQDLKAFYPKPSIETEYLLHWYLSKAEIIENMGTGSTVKGIKLDDIKTLPIDLPPLPEQQKIAAILTSVDEVIEKTQAQINKLKDLKTGMMQELLTRGVGVDGKPHTEFKDSPVGRIPKGWAVVKLSDTGKWKGGGTPSKSNKNYWSGSIPWVSPKDMKLDLISRTKDLITEDAIKGSSTNLITKNSLLMVVRSGILQHTLPVAIAACDLTINQDMKALSVSKGYCVNFIFYYLQAHNHTVLRATLKAGNTVESIDFNEFGKYLIPSPSLEEQVRISDVIASISNKIKVKEYKLSSLKNTKKALMQDLLTGKVRVKVDS